MNDTTIFLILFTRRRHSGDGLITGGLLGESHEEGSFTLEIKHQSLFTLKYKKFTSRLQAQFLT
jgi:hypothetical protein